MKELLSTDNAILQPLKIDFLSERGVQLFIQRDDLIDQEVSGNKWRKLKYNLVKMLEAKCDTLITFGGAYSNHLLATAKACQLAGVKCIGIVRGDELSSDSNLTLSRCAAIGMKLKFVTREAYSLRNEKIYKDELVQAHPGSFLVPEGGANYLGMIGCQEILVNSNIDYTDVFVAQGTSTTSCGLLLGESSATYHVVPVLKGYDSLGEMRRLFLTSGFDDEFIRELMTRVCVHDQYHFGGYGKYNDELISFIQMIYSEYAIPLDPIYTGKSFYALWKEIHSGRLDGKKVVFIHTGGLQVIPEIESKIGRRLFQ